MKVTFQGFQLFAGDGISSDDFSKILLAGSSVDDEHDFNGHKRIFLFEKDSDPEYFTGLLITIKDQRKLCELRNDAGTLKIKVSELEQGSQLMDFNFYVLHKKTFCGVYQHYFASCSPSRFGLFLREFFWKPERDARLADQKKKIIHDGERDEAVAEKKARKLFRKNLGFSLFYKPEDFAKLMEAMASIEAFYYDIGTKEANEDGFVPHGTALKSVQRKVIFANKRDVKGVTKAVAAFVKKFKPKRGKVVALDEFDEETPINITRNVEGFGEFEFDEVAAEIELDLENFSQSWVTVKLLEAARANSALFGKP